MQISSLNGSQYAMPAQGASAAPRTQQASQSEALGGEEAFSSSVVSKQSAQVLSREEVRFFDAALGGGNGYGPRMSRQTAGAAGLNLQI